MRLTDAQLRCAWSQAKLIVSDGADPCYYGSTPPTAFGALYLWAQGHSIPMLVTGFTDDQPNREQQVICSCGASHNMVDDKELLTRLLADSRWEAVCPLPPLEALAKLGGD